MLSPVSLVVVDGHVVHQTFMQETRVCVPSETYNITKCFSGLILTLAVICHNHDISPILTISRVPCIDFVENKTKNIGIRCKKNKNSNINIFFRVDCALVVHVTEQIFK